MFITEDRLSQELWTFRFGASWNLNKTVTCTELELELKLMGISSEQFRSGIGTYGNFLKTKDASLRFKDRYWNLENSPKKARALIG